MHDKGTLLALVSILGSLGSPVARLVLRDPGKRVSERVREAT